MSRPKHKVFISYHHANDQGYKESLINWNASNDNDIFIDASVDTGDIDENLNDESIRQKIRDEYLRDSTVTILLVGTETKNRKHIDWEIYSSIYDGQVNKKSGVLVINLPSTGCTTYTAAHGDEEKEALYSDNSSWVSVTTRTDGVFQGSCHLFPIFTLFFFQRYFQPYRDSTSLNLQAHSS
jgi:hypothetical protein